MTTTEKTKKPAAEKKAPKKKSVTAMTAEEKAGKAMKMRMKIEKLKPRLDPKNNASPGEVEQARNFIAEYEKELAELEGVTKPVEPEKKPEKKTEPEIKKPRFETVKDAANAFKEGKITEKEFEAAFDELTTKKKASGEKKPRTPGADTDKYGSRPGSISFAMNAALFGEDGKLRAIKVISALSGASEARVRGHIRWLKNRGHKID